MNYNYCEELSSDCSVCEQFPVKGCFKLGVLGGWRQETSAIRYHCDFKNPKTRRRLKCIKKFLAFWPERLTWDLKCGRWSPFPLARKLSCCPTTRQKWWVASRLGESGAKRQLYASAKMGCWLLHGWWKINWIIFESCQNYILQNRNGYSQKLFFHLDRQILIGTHSFQLPRFGVVGSCGQCCRSLWRNLMFFFSSTFQKAHGSNHSLKQWNRIET